MNPSVDMSWITSPIDDLTTQYSGLFLQYGNDLLWSIATIVLIIYAFKHGMTGGLVHFLIQYVPMVLLAANLLKYYDVPLPGSSVSFHQLFPAFAQELTSQMDISQMDNLFRKFAALLMGLQQPTLTDVVMIPVYMLVQTVVWILESVMFAMIAVGFVALGVGSLLGPLFIPWIIVPRLSHYFWNWLNYMLQYSFYRVVATAIVYVLSGFLITFMDKTVHGQYTLAAWLVLLPQAAVVTVAVLWSCFKVTGIVMNLFSGSSSAGALPVPMLPKLRL